MPIGNSAYIECVFNAYLCGLCALFKPVGAGGVKWLLIKPADVGGIVLGQRDRVVGRADKIAAGKVDILFKHEARLSGNLWSISRKGAERVLVICVLF